MSTFTAAHASKLTEYVHMSGTAGSRSDYVQGGGGNTSVKVDNKLMAIKASGFRLDQITSDNAYAVIDYAAVRAFYENTDPATLADVEKEGSAQAKAATLAIEGLPQLRPSVEVGFHSLLDTFVLHTHPVYANLAGCATDGAQILDKVLADLSETHAFVPYINPGAQLTFEIGKARRAVAEKTGRQPAIILMQNHGLVITAANGETCLRLNDEVNKRIAAEFGVCGNDWPAIQVVAGNAENTWTSKTPWLRDHLLNTAWDLDFFTKQSLYPDQLVFLAGQLGVIESGKLSSTLAKGLPLTDKCTIFRETGEVYYQCGRNEAKTIEETLCAIFFITGTIKRTGRTVCTMDESGKSFISGWESEKYRRSLASK